MQFTRQHVLLSEHFPIETLGRGTVWCQMLPRILDKSSAEKIISQGRPALLLSRPPSFPFTSYASLGTLFPPRCYGVEKETYHRALASPSPLDFLDLSCFSVDKTGDDATWHLTYMEKSRSQRRNFVVLSLAFLSRPIKRHKYSSRPSFLSLSE